MLPKILLLFFPFFAVAQTNIEASIAVGSSVPNHPKFTPITTPAFGGNPTFADQY